MEPNNLGKLITKRQQWVQSSKENNFDFDSILAGIYNDPSHFIYEILQNAEDAGAKEITFNLSEDRLEIVHDGKDFDFKDVDGITGIGISTKKEDVNAIGKFGVGFKSVFAITKSPVIHSASYHFKIEDFVIPVIIENNSIQKTQIILPFNHPSRSKEEVFEIVSNKLESIELKTLLFLKNIEEIKWQTPEKSGHYYKNTNRFMSIKDIHEVSIISKVEQNEKFEEYLVIHRPLQIDGHTLKVEVAYRIEKEDSGKETIVKEKDSKLIVFFPTEKITYLNFLIQGPYKTTPNRENIPLDDEQNQYIIEETAILVAESIETIKEIGLLNVPFLEVLPINQNYPDEIIYSSIYEKVNEKLLSDEAFLPTSKGSFTTASDALLARGQELTEFLNRDDIDVLFGKKNWLDTKITYDRRRELRDYLINALDVKEVDFEDFAVNINTEFIGKKSDNWLIDFYSRLLDQRSLWIEGRYYGRRNVGVLREKPIIRLSDKSHIEPYDANKKIQVYLPLETKSKYKTVKERLTKNESSLKFLTELGLTKPDIFAEIREFVIPKYQNSEIDISMDEYFGDFEKLLNAYKEDSSDKKSELICYLKRLCIVYSSDSFSGKKQFNKPNEVYLKTPELSEYFKGYDSVFFVSDELYQNFTSDDNALTKFLQTIGCEDKPRRIRVEPELTGDEKHNLRKNNYYNGLTHEIHTIDYDYEGLSHFLEDLTLNKSSSLWDFLLKNMNDYDKWNKSSFFKGEYKWKYFRENTANFDSVFSKTLVNSNWLFDMNNNPKVPSEITISDLPNEYNKDDENVEILIKALNFQLDEIKILEKKTGGKFISQEEYEEYLEFKADQKKKEEIQESEKEEEERWTPEVEPESAKTAVEELEPEIIETRDYRGQIVTENRTEETTKEPGTGEQDEHRDERLVKQIKDIGKWGERKVFEHLKDKFENNDNIEIRWLNEDGDGGKGYDFVIISDGCEIEYIEVKSKIDEEPHLFEITGTQWEFARKLFNDGEGDKYRIYIVSSVGLENAKIKRIKNPTKLWKEGKLYAHPVHLKL